AKQVQEVFTNHLPLLELQVSGRVIRTTAEHPFFVRGRGWTAAGELMAGDRLRSHDERLVVVEKVVHLREEAPVYNLRIADYHTYFVGSRDWRFSVWAHNQCNLHHPIPRVVGGNARQHLQAVDRALYHLPFHRAFQANLNASGVAINTMGGMSRHQV